MSYVFFPAQQIFPPPPSTIMLLYLYHNGINVNEIKGSEVQRNKYKDIHAFSIVSSPLVHCLINNTFSLVVRGGGLDARLKREDDCSCSTPYVTTNRREITTDLNSVKDSTMMLILEYIAYRPLAYSWGFVLVVRD